MKNHILIFVLLTGISSVLFAQENLSHKEFLEDYVNMISEDFEISIRKPKQFKLLKENNTAVKIRKDKNKMTGSAYGPVFLSKDEDCLAMYSAYPIDDARINIGWNKNKGRRMFPRGQITAELKTSLGLYYEAHHPLNDDTTEIDFNKYVTVLSGRKAKKMFNADSIYIYSLPDADSLFIVNEQLEQVRSRNYPHCTGVISYKMNRGIMDVKLFFTDRGKKREKKYIKSLCKKIWFD